VSPEDTDIPITERDWLAFQDACADVVTDDRALRRILADIGFPASRIPALSATTPQLTWFQIFEELRRGVVPTPYRRLLGAVLRQWPGHSEFRRLQDVYLPPPATRQEAAVSQQTATPENGGDLPLGNPNRKDSRLARPAVLMATAALALLVGASAVVVAVAVSGGDDGRPPTANSPGATHPASTSPPGSSPQVSIGPAQSALPGGCSPSGGTVITPEFFPSDQSGTTDVKVTNVSYVLSDAGTALTVDIAIAFTGTPAAGDRLYLYSREDKLSAGSGPGRDGYTPGDDAYWPELPVTPEDGCWRGTVHLGDAEEVGLDFDLFVVMVDEAAYQAWIQNPPSGKIYVKADITNGAGNFRWLTQIEVPTP
jgi:hypothetical protein